MLLPRSSSAAARSLWRTSAAVDARDHRVVLRAGERDGERNAPHHGERRNERGLPRTAPGGRIRTAVSWRVLTVREKCPRDRRRTLAQSPFVGNARLPGALNNGVSAALIWRGKAANIGRLTRIGPPPISRQPPRRPVRRGSLCCPPHEARKAPRSRRIGPRRPHPRMRNRKDLPLMFAGLARKLFGSANERQIKGYRPRVDEINALEKELEALSDEALRARTDDFRQATRRRQDARRHPRAGLRHRAARRAKRTLGQRHFDVQLIGGMILHEGKISEMKTGEGKTLVATLAVYLNALAGRGVHVVTVNDYLAKRDAEWMGQIYNFLGLTVGVIVHGLDDRGAQGGLRLRRDLRHQQRARLRLPARQHEVPARRHGAARPCLRHRRRGGLDPDRRGAHAADHLRPARRPL